MSRARSVWLVARREIIERGRSRGYLLSLVLTIVLLMIFPQIALWLPDYLYRP